LTEKILELVESVLKELHDHDSKVDARIAAASAANVDAVTKIITKRSGVTK